MGLVANSHQVMHCPFDQGDGVRPHLRRQLAAWRSQPNELVYAGRGVLPQSLGGLLSVIH
jgi:hypothetical protein